jgi:hypothetical protein
MKTITDEHDEYFLMVNGNDVLMIPFIFLNYFIRNNCKSHDTLITETLQINYIININILRFLSRILFLFSTIYISNIVLFIDSYKILK